jgi:purine-binding chemotaxis protein CheW
MGSKQYVVFNLEDEEYGIDIAKICEINRLKEIKITKVPKVASYIQGIINLRGDIVPIVNLREKVGLDSKILDKDSRVIILNVNQIFVGILVDRVSSVLIFDEMELMNPPEEINNDFKFINRIGYKKDHTIFIFDIEKALKN